MQWIESFKESIKTRVNQGLYLKGLREENKLTQQELARRMGTSQTKISYFENGRKLISEKIADQILCVLSKK